MDGNGNLEEIKDALEVLISGGLKKQNILLHCSTEYPSP